MSSKNRLFTLSGIKRDHERFKSIVKGQVRKDLKEYISNGSLNSRNRNGKVSISLPSIDLPQFTFGSDQDQSGVSQGNGEGEAGGQGKSEPGKKGGEGKEAGKEAGKHELEVELKVEELAEMLGDELELPQIKSKGKKLINSQSHKYKSIHNIGPQSLRHYKRTFNEALKRQIASGVYDPKNPVIVPIKKDFRFRGWSTEEAPHANAVVVYMMDVSGSMGDEQKEIVRTQAFWIDAWLKTQYKGLECRYIIHDATAREVDGDTFFRTRESGGTLISSAYQLLLDMIKKDYPIQDWNIYPFHFSDGDNWSNEDTKHCLSLLKDQIIPIVNQFSYAQVESRYGSGQFYKDLEQNLKDVGTLVSSRIPNRDAIYQSIKDFLGKGN